MSLSKKEELEYIELQKQQIKEDCENSLYKFARVFFSIIEPSVDFVNNWHIGAICEHLQAVTNNQIRHLLINIPPRFMKSILTCVMWPCWVWTFKPETKWLFSSYAQKLSTRDSVKCRRLINSLLYQQLWEDTFQITTDQNEKNRFENNKTGYRLAASVGGSITGEGGNVVCVDDPHKISEAFSDAKRGTAIEWWFNEMSTRLNDPKRDHKVIIMQRVHESDLSGEVLERGGFDHLCIPMEFEGPNKMTSIGWVDPRKREGELLWGERFGKEEVEVLKKNLGSMMASGQLQQSPAPDTGLYLKREWWRYYLTKPDHFDEIIQSWDCSFKGEEQNDFVCGQVWGKKGSNKYLLDQFKQKTDIIGTISAIEAMTKKWPRSTAKIVEEKANGAAVIALLKNKISGLIPYNPGRDGKVERVIAVQPEIEAGNVWLPSKSICDWDIDKFVANCAKFPTVKHDDDIDAMTQALLRFQKIKRARLPIEEEKDNVTYAPSIHETDW